MKRLFRIAMVGALLLPPAVLAQSASPSLDPTKGQLAQTASVANAPEIPARSVPDFIKLPPDLYLGEAMGVATNSKGHVFVFTRSQRTRLFEFDENGTFVREIAPGLYGFVFAHGLRIDGDDNIWAVDEGSNMVIKMNPEGRVLMVLGRRPSVISGPNESDPRGKPVRPEPIPYEFDRPTDVAWDGQGNIFVADGYGNSRVAKYDRNGKFLAQTPGPGNGPGQMQLPHSLQVDAAGNVYVADRQNNRIQVFDNDLHYKAAYTNVGQPWTLCISPGPHQYLFASNSYPDRNDSRMKPFTGEIYKMELDGTVVGKFGRAGKKPGEFSTTHGLDCRNPNQIYVGEITSWRVQKILLENGGN